MASVESLAQCLQSTLMPDPQARKTAERTLEDMQMQSGFPALALQLTQAQQATKPTRQGL